MKQRKREGADRQREDTGGGATETGAKSLKEGRITMGRKELRVCERGCTSKHFRQISTAGTYCRSYT